VVVGVVADQVETVAMVLLASHKEAVHPRTLWSSTCTRQSSSPWNVSDAAVLQAASMLILFWNMPWAGGWMI
jgi:DNA repair protein RadC